MDKKSVHVIGGGTISHVRTHLALVAPAFGTTARKLSELCLRRSDKLWVDLHLTKMADQKSTLETNDDVSKLVDQLILSEGTKIIFFNPALVDFNAANVISVQSHAHDHDSDDIGKHAPRLSTSDGTHVLTIEPAEKIVRKIRAKRKDIFLVAFKTTSGATEHQQYLAGLKLLKEASCNLVLANDTLTRKNMIITPEEAKYCVTTDRDAVLYELVKMTYLRSHLTFTRSTVVDGQQVEWNDDRVPAALRNVVDYCISEGAYKPFMGTTVGHFACKLDETTFLTSKRKTNFNDLSKHGLVLVKTDGPDSVIAYGAKPSVGGQSQRIVFSEHPEYDCIVHFHCPKKVGSLVPSVSQREFECGSHQCGQNTSRGLKNFGNFSAVFLEEHGPNIVFHSSIDPNEIKKFISDNFDLYQKTGGYVK